MARPADRVVLKTCGTTKLLSCVPFMCQLAAGIGMAPARVKYTRASFLFPEQQPAPHTSFEQVGGPSGRRQQNVLRWRRRTRVAAAAAANSRAAAALRSVPASRPRVRSVLPCVRCGRVFIAALTLCWPAAWQECDTLRDAFKGLGSTSAYVLGDGLNGLQWHVFVAGKRCAAWSGGDRKAAIRCAAPAGRPACTRDALRSMRQWGVAGAQSRPCTT